MSKKCEECGLRLPERETIWGHWKEEMSKGNGHYHCSLCSKFFRDPTTYKRHNEQLICPGCETPFARVGGLISHIENNHCKVIDNEQLAARREEKLKFARELHRRHFGADPGLEPLPAANRSTCDGSTPDNNFTRYLSKYEEDVRNLNALRPVADDTVRPDPLTFRMKEAEFPRQLFPDAPPPARPTPEQLKNIREPPKTKLTYWPEHHPRNPNFDVQKYWVPYLRKYKCPHTRCPKSFGSSSAICQHLESELHNTKITVQCPQCMKWFDGMAALAQHTESEATKCFMRHTEGYRPFIDQLTAGVVDVVDDDKNDDGSLKYTVPKEAHKVFNPRLRNTPQGEEEEEDEQAQNEDDKKKKSYYYGEHKGGW
ncbi:hypothetical protein QBC46DRAFT_260245 [Diplogelasinospora grovesii]|uniref:C2H2-type domain-containing protein n=1 Tax=Diplogelasinospora grovesii TaxID=303347 RepID=A0AAN6N7T1_9PEZI|nr:hypothetical protein QBC46DRAFT_260245 [Diplogelasinospora grovesii]